MVTIGIPGYGEGELLGRGGFGSVYRVDDARHGRQVAIKILEGTLDDDARRRFERERASMGQLGAHPAIVPVFDSGFTDDGRAYLVMEYAPGDSLRQVVDRDGPMTWPDACSRMVAIARGVAAAHDAGILHRDIKPDNILLDAYGNAKLGDFGIATVTSGATTTKGASTTLAHASPELLEGMPASTSMDVYALGSTTHALLSGRPPFSRPGDELAAPMLRRILSEPPPDLRVLGVPSSIADEVERALAKDAGDRHESAKAFADALEAATTEASSTTTGQPGSTVGSMPSAAISSPPHATVLDGALGAVAPAGVGAGDQTVVGSPEAWRDVADLGTPPEPAAASERNRTPLLIAGGLLLVGLLAAVIWLSTSRDTDDSATATTASEVTEPSTTPTTTPTTASTQSPTTETTQPAAPAASIQIDCPSTMELGVRLECDIISSNATSGSWNLPGFTDGPLDLETVPGASSIFLEPNDASQIGSTFVLSAEVRSAESTASATHTIELVGPPGPSVEIECPDSIQVNTEVICDVVSERATGGSWEIPGFTNEPVPIETVPGTHNVFIAPSNSSAVGQSFTLSAEVVDAEGQVATASHSFTVTG